MTAYNEWGSEKALAGLPTAWAASEPVDTATARLAIGQLQHRLESRVQPLCCMAQMPGGPAILDYGPLILAVPPPTPPTTVAKMLLLWAGYLPVLDGGRLPRIAVEAEVACSAAPAAGQEPMVGVLLELPGSTVTPPYAESTTTDTVGPTYVMRRFSSTTPTVWRPSVTIDPGAAPAGDEPWVWGRLWLLSGQQAAPTWSTVGPYAIVSMVSARLFGGEA